MRESSIDSFVADLSALRPHSDDVFNPYAADGDENNAIRRHNLARYLEIMQARQPRILMTMEAPGYRGCRLTGLPVTSRRVMLQGVPGIDIFGPESPFRDVHDEGFDDVQGEQSATIVWTALGEQRPLPLIWNTYPLHPHKKNDQRSNRRPRKAETMLGSAYLRTLLMLFKPEIIIAVGNVAEETLMGMGVNCVKVRHPANGGKDEFVAGLQRLLDI